MELFARRCSELFARRVVGWLEKSKNCGRNGKMNGRCRESLGKLIDGKLKAQGTRRKNLES